MEKIHIIGANGFIGKAVQRNSTKPEMEYWSSTDSENSKKFDIYDNTTWKSILSERPANVILLSWPGLPNYHEKFHITRNLIQSIELLDKLIENGLKRITITGTCYEYGEQCGCLKEDHLTNPVNNYAIAKDTLRRIVANRCKQEKIEWYWVRVFYPYGQGQNPKSLLPSLEKAIRDGTATFPMGSGRQIRDFVDVDLVAQQLITLAKSGSKPGVYNAGSGFAQSVLEIAENLVKKYKSPIVIKRWAYTDRQDEPLAFWANMNKYNSFQGKG